MIFIDVTKNEIIAELATARMAERMVAFYCRAMEGRPELADLSQLAYLTLLQMEDERIRRAHEEGWLPFLLRRIIITNVRNTHSPWHDLFRRYGLRNLEMVEDYNEIPEEL